MPKHKETIEKHLPLVVSIAKCYSGHGVPLEDLVQEGSSGLQRAIEGFDPQRGYKFSTYATWWIRQSITRTFHNQGRSDISFANFDLMLKMKKTEEKLMQELKREPTEEELAKRVSVRPKKIRELKNLERGPLSLDQPIKNRNGEETKETLGDIIASDGESSDPLARVFQEELRSEITSFFQKLNPKQREVLERRFPTNGQKPQTLDEIGNDLRITRERVRQRQAEGLERLKRLPPSVLGRIKPFLIED